MEPTQAISYDTVSRVRDAFADLIKQRNKEELANRASQAVAIVMSHVHDEATMKVRSYIYIYKRMHLNLLWNKGLGKVQGVTRKWSLGD